MFCVVSGTAIAAKFATVCSPLCLLKTRITILIITPNELPQNRQLALA
jgi:hypothetical protein